MNDDPKVVRTVGKYTIKVVQSKCIAAASCVAISPDIFKLNEANLVEIIEGGVDEEDNILLAAQSCPTGAIEIYENDPSAHSASSGQAGSGQARRVWPPEV
jgi:ferredoxin